MHTPSERYMTAMYRFKNALGKWLLFSMSDALDIPGYRHSD